MTRVRYFSVLAQTKHVRKAAAILRINPASLSRAIKTLESELGIRLVVPSGRGIEITDQGMSFFRHSQGLLREYQALRDHLLAPEGREPAPLRIGSMEVFTTYFLSMFVEKLAGNTRIRTRYLTPGRIEESLKRREIDIGVSYIQIPDDELRYIKVGQFRMALLGTQSMLRRRWEDLPFAVPIDGLHVPGISLRSLDGWPQERFPRKIQFEFELLETALQVSRLGKAVVYCPDFIARLHNAHVRAPYHLEELPLPENFGDRRLSIFLVARKNEEESPAIRHLAKLARSLV